jgi:hypothetical protein
VPWIGLEKGKTVAPTNGRKPAFYTKFLKQKFRMALHFIGTNGKNEPIVGEAIK